MILRIHHVQITIPVGEEERGRSFYCDILGLPEIEKPAALKDRGGFWVEVGDRQVHVGVEERVERTATRAHLAYEVNNLPQWRQKLADAGIDILEGIAIPGFDRFEFRDPFGNRVELIQPLPAKGEMP